ncbi:MAG: formyltetrahydrofolate-dependent phosphoribosylglycinamide formyltransferase [Chitinophagaceae bacterium]|nr:formyltetrahydrofolate-dependent phosphoribosylglycinamide formyltransferase [Chitinophagaceae bacterium]
MFERLQQKWKVSGSRLALILCTFAAGGSLTGYAAKKIMGQFPVEKDGIWILIYILLVTIIWPLAVLIVSIPFGQYVFFRNYLQRVGAKLGISGKEPAMKGPKPEPGSKVVSLTSQPPITIGSPPMTRVAIFASGAGTNAQKIIDHFRQHPFIKVSLIVCNKAGAGILKIAEKENIPHLLIEREKFYNGNAYVDELKQNKIDFIVLAGFLWKIPIPLIKAFAQKIINIHPALLPAFGGKGMYGHKVHEAVIAAGKKESGITIHYVDEIYDHGQIIYQARCPVLPDDTPGLLAQKIHELEHEHFSRVIEELLIK